MTAAATHPRRPQRPATNAAPAPDVAPAEGPRLRLAATRGTLGLELDAPYALRPLRIAALSLTFPNIRFPIDLSGGVARFRHRRGALARLVVDVSADELATWVAPRLRGLLRDGTPETWLAPIEGGLAVGLADGEAALAFDVLALPDGIGLTLVPERARGIGLGAPPQALALRALAAALRGVAQVRGGALRVPDAGVSLLLSALPDAGARAPSTRGVTWDVPRIDDDRLRLEAHIDAGPPALPDRLVRASETLLLASDADDASYRNDTEAARDAYLSALERAPRHPEISERLAWLDTVAGERAEAALSTLIDVTPAVDAGLLGAELLAAVGDAEGARGALMRAARAEPFGPLAARTWMRAAALAEDLHERLATLDEAVARAPALADARWARLAGRLTAADPRGALADAQHLEAAARGARPRHEIARRAARAFLAEGFSSEAHRLFERALRYVPDDAEAVAGLARALAAQGAARRALDLYARALGLAERAGSPTSAVAVDLARALVDVAADRPAAIARVRGVPASAPEAAEARLLEARWRAELGDLAGAGLAIGRLRDHAERDPLAGAGAPVPGTAAAARAGAMATLLAEAAVIDERFRDDLAGAQRDLGLALRLAPRDGRLQAAFRRVAREHARRGAAAAGTGAGGAPAMPPPPRRAAAAVRGRGPAPAVSDAGERLEASIADERLSSAIADTHALLANTHAPLADTHAPLADTHAPLGHAATPRSASGAEPLSATITESHAPFGHAAAPRSASGAEPLSATITESHAPFGHAAAAAPRSATGRESLSATITDTHGGLDPWSVPGAEEPPISMEPEVPEHGETRGSRSSIEQDEAPPPSSETLRNEETLAERLSERVRANPRDRSVVLALCDVLERIGRDLELFALLSARMDEGDDEERGALAPRRRMVLARLASRARAAGNHSEAELYEMMLDSAE